MDIYNSKQNIKDIGKQIYIDNQYIGTIKNSYVNGLNSDFQIFKDILYDNTIITSDNSQDIGIHLVEIITTNQTIISILKDNNFTSFNHGRTYIFTISKSKLVIKQIRSLSHKWFELLYLWLKLESGLFTFHHKWEKFVNFILKLAKNTHWVFEKFVEICQIFNGIICKIQLENE